MTSLLGRNVGTFERVARIVLGAVVLSLVFVGPKTAWGWIGLVPLLTGIIGSCPLYSVFGFSTCPVRKHSTTTN